MNAPRTKPLRIINLCVCTHFLFQAELIRRDYAANNGWETFLSYEDPQQDILIGLLRLRKCSEDTFRPELKGGCSIVRELHVYGSVVPVHGRDPTKFQHQVIYRSLVLILLLLAPPYNNYRIFFEMVNIAKLGEFLTIANWIMLLIVFLYVVKVGHQVDLVYS